MRSSRAVLLLRCYPQISFGQLGFIRWRFALKQYAQAEVAISSHAAPEDTKPNASHFGFSREHRYREYRTEYSNWELIPPNLLGAQ